MKTVFYFLTMMFFSICFIACEKDNLEDIAPNASFEGEFRDAETGELVGQEIRNGSRVYFIELGWPNPPVQSLPVKSDGTFMNKFMFAGDYKIILDKGNYVPLDTINYKMSKGKNREVFKVTPYIRVIDPVIELVGNEVVAKFKLKQNTSDDVGAVYFLMHTDAQVSYYINSGWNRIIFDRTVSPSEEHEIRLDVSKYKKGQNYFFRLGAGSKASEARYNYGPIVKIAL